MLRLSVLACLTLLHSSCGSGPAAKPLAPEGATPSPPVPRSENPTPEGGGQEWSRVACDHPLTGPSLPPNSPELGKELESRLQSLIVDEVPETIVLGKMANLTRARLFFLLKLPTAESFTKKQALDAGRLGKVVLAAFWKDGQFQATLEDAVIQQGFFHYYACETQIPPTLKDFAAWAGNYSAWKSKTLHSAVKSKTVRLRENGDSGIYMRETLVGETVRETEVIASGLRADGNLDFFVYGSDGTLSNRSTYAPKSGEPQETVRSSPAACLGCHFNRETLRFDVLMR